MIYSITLSYLSFGELKPARLNVLRGRVGNWPAPYTREDARRAATDLTDAIKTGRASYPRAAGSSRRRCSTSARRS